MTYLKRDYVKGRQAAAACIGSGTVELCLPSRTLPPPERCSSSPGFARDSRSQNSPDGLAFRARRSMRSNPDDANRASRKALSGSARPQLNGD